MGTTIAQPLRNPRTIRTNRRRPGPRGHAAAKSATYADAFLYGQRFLGGFAASIIAQPLLTLGAFRHLRNPVPLTIGLFQREFPATAYATHPSVRVPIRRQRRNQVPRFGAQPWRGPVAALPGSSGRAVLSSRCRTYEQPRQGANGGWSLILRRNPVPVAYLLLTRTGRRTVCGDRYAELSP